MQGAVALVTGANGGIGRALVAALLERKAAKVYAAGRRLSDVEGASRRRTGSESSRFSST